LKCVFSRDPMFDAVWCNHGN